MGLRKCFRYGERIKNHVPFGRFQNWNLTRGREGGEIGL